MKYMVRFVHKISPSAKDVMGPIEIRDGAWSNRNTLAKALRDARVMPSGGRLSSFRSEGDKVVAFPVKSVWHAFVITPATGTEKATGVDYPGYGWTKVLG